MRTGVPSLMWFDALAVRVWPATVGISVGGSLYIVLVRGLPTEYLTTALGLALVLTWWLLGALAPRRTRVRSADG